MNSPAPCSARLLLRIGGTGVSEDEVHSRCDQVAKFAVVHAGCKSWVLQDLLRPSLHIPYGRPPRAGAGFDFDGGWIVAETMEAERCTDNINTWDLSLKERQARDRRFGRMTNGNGDLIARFNPDLG